MIRRLGPGDEETLRELDRRFKEHIASPEAAAAFLRDGRHVVLVCEHARRHGVGRTLVEEAKRIGREAGAFEMYVLTEPENLAANGLYEATGASDESAVMWLWALSPS